MTISEQIIDEFARIHSASDKYRLACELVTTLRPSCPALAGRIFKYLADRPQNEIVANNIEQGLYYLLELLTKATYGLARSGNLTDRQLTRVTVALSHLQEPYLRLGLLSRLAFYMWKEGLIEFFTRMVNEEMWPLLAQLLPGDERSAHSAWRNAYPCLWLEDRDRARASIADFSPGVRSSCASALCYALLRRQPPGEPFDGEPESARGSVHYSDVQKLLQLCEETEEDFTILSVTEWIAHAISTGATSSHLNRTQRAEIARRILEIAQTRLPIEHWIKHTGYQILTKAQALRVAEVQGTSWEELVGEAKTLENAADRVYVLAHLAAHLPNKRKKSREELYKIVEADADALITIEDRFQRYYALASLAASRDKQRASRMIRKAYETATNFEGRRYAVKENHLVDLAYRVDPDLPMQMAVLYDDDPARDEYRKRAQRQINRHKLKRDIGDNRSEVDLATRRNDPDLAAAAWRALGSLNAGRMIPSDAARLREMFTAAGNYPLATAFPMYSWALSNLILKYSDTPDGAKYMRNAFEGILRATNFMHYFVGDRSGLAKNLEWRDLADVDGHIVVRGGERERGIEFLEDWVKRNADEYLTIVDPYFRPSEVEIVFRVMKVDMNLRVQVLTGKSSQREIVGNLPEAYSDAWRRICDQSPPDAEILVVGYVGSGDAPFHDRWILSKSAGLRVGTSLNSLGKSVSEISSLGIDELKGIQRTVSKFQSKVKQDNDGNRISYESFELLA